MDHDGSLSLAEFSIAMHCVAALEAGYPLPVVVPVDLKESLLHHVTRSTENLTTSSTTTAAGFVLIQLTEAGEEKTPEKSSLKTSGSCSKGVSVHFKEEFLLSRSRPRPTRRLVTTTPLHLKPNQIVSSSSYYSSDNSDSEADRHLVARKLDMSSDKVKSSSSRKKNKSSSSSKGEKGGDGCPGSPLSKTRRERTYDDPADILANLEIEDGAEDAEALIQPSESENEFPPSSPPPTSPPPTGPPLSRAPTRPSKAPPPMRQPSRPSLPPPCSSPPPPLASSPEEEGHSSSSYKEGSDGVMDPEGYERLGDPELPPAITLDQGECEESEGEDGVTPRPAATEDTLVSRWGYTSTCCNRGHTGK
eukprot:sb/3465995/